MADIVLRPFSGLPSEPDWIAMREIIPAATGTAQTTKEYGAKQVVVTTMLPLAWPAMHREDGTVMLALQTPTTGRDASQDLAAALLAALAAPAGTPIEQVQVAPDAPRLQDVLDLSVDFNLPLHEGFDYWFAPGQELDAETQAGLAQANDSIIETHAVSGIDHAYWCKIGSKVFLRWARAEDEDVVINAISTLQGKRAARIGNGKFIGAFRTAGIVIPVWEFPRSATAQDIDAATQAFAPAFQDAIGQNAPLDADGRRARAGIVARQVTLR